MTEPKPIPEPSSLLPEVGMVIGTPMIQIQNNTPPKGN